MDRTKAGSVAANAATGAPRGACVPQGTSHRICAFRRAIPLILRRAEGPSRRIGGNRITLRTRHPRRGKELACLIRSSAARSPLSPCGRARAHRAQAAKRQCIKNAHAVRGKWRGRVETMNHERDGRKSPLTVPAIRRASRAGREALSRKGRGEIGHAFSSIDPGAHIATRAQTH